MIAILCITILAYLISGKDVKPLVDKVRNVDWQGKAASVLKFLKRYAFKVGKVAARPLVMFYYVLTDADTTPTEKAMIYGCLLYVVLPVSLIPRSVYRFFGLMDEAAAVLFVVKKVRDKITPEIEAKTDATLNSWFVDEVVG